MSLIRQMLFIYANNSIKIICHEQSIMQTQNVNIYNFIFKAKLQQYQINSMINPRILQSSSQRIVIEKSKDKNKSRWNQPLTIPAVLYAKFQIQQPPQYINKQDKIYPNSLLDYIKRAYDVCADQSQSKTIQNKLKAIVKQNQKHINQIQWENYPLPIIEQYQTKRQSRRNYTQTVQKQKNSNVITKQQIQQEKPSKALMKANKARQKFQMKLNKQNEGVEKLQQKKLFIGFTSQPCNKPPPTRFMPTINFTPPLPPPSKIAVIGVKNIPLSKQKQNITTEVNKNQKKTELKKQRVNGLITNKQKLSKQLSNQKKQLLKRYSQFNKLKIQQTKKQVVEIEDEFEDESIIVGKSKQLEKSYLRITGRPDPQKVRPQPVLKQALEFVLKKYKKEGNYDYVIDQIRSIRQDLTVQHIRNKLTVKVYEKNLEISVFQNDKTQTQNCLTNLWQLYRQNIYNDSNERDANISYQFLALTIEEKYQELQYRLTLIQASTLDSSPVQQVLKLKRSFMLGNYRAFFDFYGKVEQVCRCLLNQYIDKVRMKCLVAVCKTFGEKISLKVLAETIGEDQDMLEVLITEQGGVIKDGLFLLKQSIQPLRKSQFLAVKGARLGFD